MSTQIPSWLNPNLTRRLRKPWDGVTRLAWYDFVLNYAKTEDRDAFHNGDRPSHYNDDGLKVLANLYKVTIELMDGTNYDPIVDRGYCPEDIRMGTDSVSWVPKWTGSGHGDENHSGRTRDTARYAVRGPVAYDKFRYSHMWSDDGAALRNRGDKLDDWLVMGRLYNTAFVWTDWKVYAPTRSRFMGTDKRLLLLKDKSHGLDIS